MTDSHREAAKTAFVRAVRATVVPGYSVEQFDAEIDRFVDSVLEEMEQRIIDRAFVCDDGIGMR